MSSRRILLHILTLTALSAATLLALAAPVPAKSYTDVPKSHWAYASISSVTNRTVAGHRLLDDYKTLFRPERAITRELLARSVVLASGHYGEDITPVDIADVPKGYRYYSVIQMAVHLGYMGVGKDGTFRPTEKVTAAAAETVIVRWLKGRYPAYDWSLLSTLAPSRWRPNPDWTTGAPSYLAAVVASRQLELRYNHPTGEDGHEALPTEPIDRAEIAYMFDRAYKVASGWQLYGLAGFKDISFPALSARQKQVARFALKWIGYPYVWAGEYPTPALAVRCPEGGRVRLLGLRLLRDEDALRVPHHRERARRPRHGRPRQAAHHPQPAQVGRPHLLRPQGAELERRVDLPRGAVPRPRLVHPLHRLQRRRDPGVAQRLQLLEGGVRLGPSRAHAGGARRGEPVAVAVGHAFAGARRGASETPAASPSASVAPASASPAPALP